MVNKDSINGFKELILSSMKLEKCTKCGCMGKTIETVKKELLKIDSDDVKEILLYLQSFIDKMEKIEYS